MKPNTTYQSITSKKFQILAKYKDLYCISIYLPAHLQDNHIISQVRDRLSKKSESSQVKREVQGLNSESIERHVKELKAKLQTWRNSSVEFGLAVFISNELTEAFTLTQKVKFSIHFNDHFYLKYLAQELTSPEHSIKEILDNQDGLVSNPEEIVKLSAKGKIKILFLAKNYDLYGELDLENDFVLTYGEEENGTSLSNLAAIKTINHNGEVILLEKSKMPNPNTLINAIKQ